MRKKRFEKIIFALLMLLPLILFAVWLLCCIVKNNNGSFDLTSSNAYEMMLSFVSNGVAVGPISDAIKYFFGIFGVNEIISLAISMYVQYVVLIELVHIIYDIVIFIPRALRVILEKVIKE